MTQDKPKLILSSTSPSRLAGLKQLKLPFETISPGVQENQLPHESPENLVKRLATEKALAGAKRYPYDLIIGGDQVAFNNGAIIGKPKHFDDAVHQLTESSGKSITFYHGLCLYNASTKHKQVIVEPTQVTFRDLSHALIVSYLKKEQPYHCAGSIKAEGLGIVLIDQIHSKDPNALTALPLIQLINMLALEGITIL